ncbi:flagellar filament capping protein FliD [Campylobacter insulaenigrae]|uniref:flagellar filament capping protein FliD n=1 Tax=Campylobacter insulaenigrae TaxID=260714 RepID=UPI002152A430|nr:flagellar filament capping protein FliD [Campylobacter insulaenigrae]MCR6574926.1 flagellar filament capping protein FliD [Campylobacter insulaenigrae]
MAIGSLGSLGIGSGVLTSETLNKLKEAELNSQLKLYNSQLETNTSRQKDLAELEAKLLAFQTAVNSLGDASQFNKKKVSPSVSGDSAAAGLTVGSLSDLKNMTVKVDQLAQKDVYQSNGFKDKTDSVLKALGLGDQSKSFTITQDGKSYEIKIDKDTSFTKLAEQINAAGGGKIEAKIVNTGDKNTPYRLVVQSSETGVQNNISFSGDEALLEKLGWEIDTNSVSAGGLFGFREQNNNSLDKISGTLNSSGNITLDTKLLDGTSQTPTSLTFVLKNGSGYDRYTINIDSNTTYKSLKEELEKQSGGKITLELDTQKNTVAFKSNGGGELGIFDGGYAKDSKGNIDQDNYERDKNATDLLKNKFGITLDTNKTPQGYNVKDSTNHIQKGADAIFSVDGVQMSRPTNTIKDIGPDITLDLKQKGEINFNVAQDTEAISESLQNLAKAYNDLMLNITAATKYDPDAGTKGNFVGVSEIYDIKAQVNQILLQTITVDGTVTVGDSDTSEGTKVSSKVSLSLADFGLTLLDGTMSFDSSKFNSKVNEDPKIAEKFFVGSSGFEDLDLIGNKVDLHKLNTNNQGINFKDKDFKIVYNDETIDLSKNKDGTDFVLTGKNNAEMAKNLVDHINSFGLEGLEASFDIINNGSKDSVQFKIKGTSGSNLEIKGDGKFLGQFGLSAKTMYSKYKEETGTFGKLKNNLKEMVSSDGSFGGYKESLTKEAKNLNKTTEDTKKSIEDRYDTMWARWAAYDGIISKLNNQANVILNMINAANNQNS